MKAKLLFLSILIGAFAICLINGCSMFSKKNELKLIPVKSGDKWEYVDKDGKIIINPQFVYASLFKDNIALVKVGDIDSSKVGYIDETGKYLINPTYKYGTIYSEDLACVVPENGSPTYIDAKGEIKFTLKDAEKAYIFTEGLAAFSKLDKDGIELWGFVDNTGTVKITPTFYDFAPFSEKMAAVKNKKNKWGYINSEGTIVINYQFSDAGDFIDGKAVVSDGKTCGYINTEGKYIINPQFDFALSFSDGLAAVKQGKVWGFIDEDGKIAINPQFDEVLPYMSKMAPVKSSGKWGYIGKDGKFIINAQFDEASNFYGDIAIVKSSDKYGIIDKDGKYVANPQFDGINFGIYMSAAVYSGIMAGNSIFDADKIVETDFFDASVFASSIISSITKTDVNSFGTSTTIDNVLTKISAGDSILPDNNFETSFSIYNKKISKEIYYSSTYYFNDKLKEPIKEVSGTDWYGDPIYKIAGYQKSTKALFSMLRYSIRLSGKSAKKVNQILTAINEKISASGLKKYTLNDQSIRQYYFSSAELFVVIEFGDWFITIWSFNKNSDEFEKSMDMQNSGKFYLNFSNHMLYGY